MKTPFRRQWLNFYSFLIFFKLCKPRLCPKRTSFESLMKRQQNVTSFIRSANRDRDTRNIIMIKSHNFEIQMVFNVIY